jgi:hypothetical protein
MEPLAISDIFLDESISTALTVPMDTPLDSRIDEDEIDDLREDELEERVTQLAKQPRRSPRLHATDEVNLHERLEDWEEVKALMASELEQSTQLPLSPHLLDEAVESRNVKEMYKLPETEITKWREAMDKEIAGLNKLGTWKLVRLPPGKPTVSNKWVFKIKRNPDNTIAKYKMRLVARGFTQVYGENYNETYAPVARITTILLFVSFTLSQGLICYQYDVEQAYLHGFLKEEIYMDSPEGYEEYDKDGEPLVCKLIKGIYGLKQSAAVWHDALKERLIELDFVQLQSDACLFKKVTVMGTVYVLFYVDDVIVAATDDKLREDLINRLNERLF